MPDQITMTVAEKFLFPLILGVGGWFVKDYLFAVYAKREELVRKEWERRLLETWSPLYYWSGIVLLDGSEKGWKHHGLDELEKVLTKSAHLLPERHYNNIIKLIQSVTSQNTVGAQATEIRRTREYIYGQIKTFNYLLYKRSGWFEATTYTDFLASVKYLVRFTSQALRHLLTWLAAVVLLGGTYLAFVDEHYWAVGIVLIALLVPVGYDWYRQIKLHQELSRQTRR